MMSFALIHEFSVELNHLIVCWIGWHMVSQYMLYIHLTLHNTLHYSILILSFIIILCMTDYIFIYWKTT